MRQSVTSLLPGHSARRHSQSSASEPFSPQTQLQQEEEEEPEELPEAEENGFKLVDRELQDWALLIWFFIIFSILYALHAPISCSAHTEEQSKIPSRCHLVGDPSGLRLLDYCWWPCAAYLRTCLLLSVSLAVVSQAVVVILNHQGCSRCLRLRWHFDLSDMLGTNSGEEDKKAKSLFFKLTHPIEAVRNLSVQRLIHHATTNLQVGSIISSVSLLCVCNSVLQTAFFFIYSVSTFGSFFECTGKDGTSHHVAAVRNNWSELAAAAVSLFLQMSVLWLVTKAEWTKQISVHVEDDETLFSQFKKTTTPEGVVRYFPLEHPTDKRYKFLKRVFLMELVYVEFDGLAHRPGELGSTSGEVVLHFKNPVKKSPPETRHRIWSLLYLGVGVVMNFFASQSCWTCVQGIRVGPHLTVTEVDKLLLLMGACGRHHISGYPCWLACMALAIACAQQVIVMVASKVQERSNVPMAHDSPEFFSQADSEGGNGFSIRNTGGSLMSEEYDYGVLKKLEEPAYVEQQLTVNIVDMRRTRFLDPESYRIAEAEMPSVPSHVWVLGREERVVDCKGEIGSMEDMLRPKWRRSTRPRKVRLAEEPDAFTKSSWTRGLARIEYNPPIQCIEIKDGGTTKVQVVPPEFIAGHFHAWVVLGPRDAWEKFSIGLASGAFILGAFDVLMFLFAPDGKILSNCHEVLTGQCLSFSSVNPDHHHQLSHVAFRPSIGVWSAAGGALFALLGALAMRVCIDVRNIPDSEAPSTLRLYMAALTYGVYRLIAMVAILNGSFCRFMVKSCQKRLVGMTLKPKMKRGKPIAQALEEQHPE